METVKRSCLVRLHHSYSVATLFVLFILPKLIALIQQPWSASSARSQQLHHDKHSLSTYISAKTCSIHLYTRKEFATNQTTQLQSSSHERQGTLMHYNAVRIGAKPLYRYTHSGLLAKPCTLVHLWSRSRYTIQRQATLAQSQTSLIHASSQLRLRLLAACGSLYQVRCL